MYVHVEGQTRAQSQQEEGESENINLRLQIIVEIVLSSPRHCPVTSRNTSMSVNTINRLIEIVNLPFVMSALALTPVSIKNRY